MTIENAIKIPSDYNFEEEHNFLQILKDDKGNVYIVLAEGDADSKGISLLADASRHSPEVLKAFYALIDAYEKEIASTNSELIKSLNRK